MNNESKVIYAGMVAKASELSVEELKRVILEDAATPVLPVGVFESLMDALESKMDEKEFVLFCDEVNDLY